MGSVAYLVSQIMNDENRMTVRVKHAITEGLAQPTEGAWLNHKLVSIPER